MRIFRLKSCSSYDGSCITWDYFETYEKLLEYTKTVESLKEEDIREYNDWYEGYIKGEDSSLVYEVIEVK